MTAELGMNSSYMIAQNQANLDFRSYWCRPGEFPHFDQYGRLTFSR